MRLYGELRVEVTKGNVHLKADNALLLHYTLRDATLWGWCLYESPSLIVEPNPARFWFCWTDSNHNIIWVSKNRIIAFLVRVWMMRHARKERRESIKRGKRLAAKYPLTDKDAG